MTDPLEWRYLPRGQVKHRLSRNGAVGDLGVLAECGISAASWYGTGAQQEYEELASRRRCQRCCRALGLAIEEEEK